MFQKRTPFLRTDPCRPGSCPPLLCCKHPIQARHVCPATHVGHHVRFDVSRGGRGTDQARPGVRGRSPCFKQATRGQAPYSGSEARARHARSGSRQRSWQRVLLHGVARLFAMSMIKCYSWGVSGARREFESPTAHSHNSPTSHATRTPPAEPRARRHNASGRSGPPAAVAVVLGFRRSGAYVFATMLRRLGLL